MKKIFAAILIFTSSVASSADFKVDINEWSTSINLDGEIRIGDANKFIKAFSQTKEKLIKLKKNHSESFDLYLNSQGGSVEEAMKIGYFVRKELVKTHIGFNKRCYSACVLVMVAGVDRSSYGEVGIHRPYFSDLVPDQSLVDIRKQTDILNENIKNYFKDMDIPVSLLDKMKSIPSNDIKILSEEDNKLFGINGIDQAYEEKYTNEFAFIYDLSSSIYRQRKESIRIICKGPTFFTDYECEQSILWGLNLDEYKKRTKIVLDKCFPKDIEKILENMSIEQKIAINKKLHICQRSVYLN